MQDLNDKITGNTLTAAEWNEVPSEIQNVIEASGQTLSSGDLQQLRKASNLVLDNIAALRAVTSGAGTVTINGYTTDGDGGGGEFYWDAASTETDNGGTIIKATAITTGRWKRLFSGAANALWFGADKTGTLSSVTAFDAALAASNDVYVPAGTYLLDSTVAITGDKNLFGQHTTSYANPKAVINYTGSGSAFSASSAEYGGISIRYFKFVGGDGVTGNYAIRSSRPQSTFEGLYFENYDGGGVQLFEAGTGSQASWNTMVKNSYYVGPASATPHIGFDFSINGGAVLVENCVAVYGAVGFKVHKGENIIIRNCGTNAHHSTTGIGTGTNYSSAAPADTVGIWVVDGKSVVLAENYLESDNVEIRVDDVETLAITNNWIVDLGATTTSGVQGTTVKIAAGTDIRIEGNTIKASGDATSALQLVNPTRCYVAKNYLSSLGSPDGALNATVLENQSSTTVSLYNNEYVREPTNGVYFDDTNKVLNYLPNQDYIVIRDEKTAGTSGGTFTPALTWNTRDLNTIKTDIHSRISLATNQITLPPGTWRYTISCPAAEVDKHRARLYNVTDTAVIEYGSSEYTPVAQRVTTHSTIEGRFTITAQKVIEVQHYCSVASATTAGYGFNANTGGVEVYTTVILYRENYDSGDI